MIQYPCKRGEDNMATEARKRANKKYNRENTFSVSFRMNKRTEEDVIEYIKKKTAYGTDKAHVKEYILSLVRKDMEDNA